MSYTTLTDMTDMTDVTDMTNVPDAEVDRQQIFPYLTYADAPAAIDWLCRVFGFELANSYTSADGRIAHASLCHDGLYVMLSSEFGQLDNHAPPGDQVATSRIHMHVGDIEEHYQHAMVEGARIVQGLQDRFWGMRSYHALDLEGYRWSFCQRIRDVPRVEVERRLLTW
ncbi:MAG: glyoxalase [Chloroflexi bacterium]|nr:glyoxalase [Chloroflexota bacterium]MYG90337.1 glyoxalase [Chloroflexota bacterium]MYJ92432.1 glyoxalase [Chloroflexota bacterium]